MKNLSHKTATQPTFENHSQMLIDKGYLENRDELRVMMDDELNTKSIQQRALSYPAHQSNHSELLKVPEFSISRSNPNILSHHEISERSNDPMSSNNLHRNNYNCRVFQDDINYSRHTTQINVATKEQLPHISNPSQQFTHSNITPSYPTGQGQPSNPYLEKNVLPQTTDYHEPQKYAQIPQHTSQEQQHMLARSIHQSSELLPYRPASSQQANYNQQFGPQLLSHQSSAHQQSSVSQHPEEPKVTINSIKQHGTTSDHTNVKNYPQNLISTSLLDSNRYIQPKNLLVHPRMSPETVVAVLSQQNTQDLLGNLNIPPDIAEEIRKSNIIGKIQCAFQKRKIGTLSIEQRKLKLEKYFEKRKQRTWNQKVSSQCRKQVANATTVQMKGKFVTEGSSNFLPKNDQVAVEINNQTAGLERLKSLGNFSPSPHSIEGTPEDTELAYQDNVINPLFQEEYDRLKYLGFN